MREKADRWINWLRQQEFEAIKKWLITENAQKTSVLEIGGGNGLWAKYLADMGFDVVSIDPEPREPSYFPVRKGNSTDLDFEDKSFDIIISSNALMYISDLNTAFSEMKRVLKSSGIMVHTVPTHYSTIFTMALQPIGYLMKLCFIISYSLKLAISAISQTKKNEESTGKNLQHKELNKQNVYHALKMLNPIRFFISWPLTTNKKWFTEIRDWKQDVWCRCFEQAGLTVKQVIPLPLAYSRHSILPFRLMNLRYRLAKQGKNTSAAYLVHFRAI